MSTTLFVHHSADYDGLFSAAVGMRTLPSDTVFVGWDYGQELVTGWERFDDVYVVDLNPGCLAGFDESAAHRDRVVWIDHHRSAIEKYRDVEVRGYRMEGVAACRLAWQWFARSWSGFPSLPSADAYRDRAVKEPLALTLAGEYDVFDLRDPRALSFQFGLLAHGYETAGQCFDLLYDDGEAGVIADDGLHGQKWMEKFAAQCCRERGYAVEFAGYRYWCLCSVHARGSIWYPDDAVPSDCQGLMGVRVMGDGKVVVSLYHRPGCEFIDHSVAAVEHGGGGHPGACGFTVTLAEALQMGLVK